MVWRGLFILKMKKNVVILTVILVIFAAFSGLFYSFLVLDKNKVIPKGYYVGKVHVGELKPEEAIKILDTFEANSVYDKPFVFLYKDDGEIIRFEFLPSQIGAKIDAKRTIEDVLANSPRGFLKRFLTIFSIKEKKVVFYPKFKIDSPEEAIILLGKIKEYINRKPSDATFVVEKDGLDQNQEPKIIIKKEKIGRKLLINDSYDILEKGIMEGKQTFTLSVESSVPKITSEMLLAIPNPKIIGSFTTYFGKYDSRPRVHNIRIASSFIDNYYLGTDETFSLVSVMGDFSEEKGYKDAYVIIGDELVPELGGGACQVATTLYNAVLLADLEVLFRRNHGIYFSIYPMGRDAVIYPPQLDLKFKNNTGAPILIQSINHAKGLTIRIIGRDTGKKVKFSYPTIKYINTAIATKDSETGQIKKTVLPTNAFRTEVVRAVLKDGKLVDKEVIRSFYRMHGDKVEVKKREKKR